MPPRLSTRSKKKSTTSSRGHSKKASNGKPSSAIIQSKSYPFILTVTLRKLYSNRPSHTAKKHLIGFAKEAISKWPGWDYKATVQLPKEQTYSGPGLFQWEVVGKINLSCNVREHDPLKHIHIRALRIIGRLIRVAEAKGKEWEVTQAIGPNQMQFSLEDAKNSEYCLGQIPTAYIQLPDDWRPFFRDDIYGLEPQIRISWDALQSFERSGYLKRSHICYHGLPGSGKTTVCERWYDILSEASPPGAIQRFTAAQTTKAGLENILIDCDPKPSVIVIEEIDKAPPENMSCLLDVCNTEGKIKKADSNRGNVEIPLQTLVICTVNNVPKFKSFMSGALASRFAHKVYFPRPSPEVMRLIAMREVRKFNGDIKWVDHALKLLEEEQTNDPRRLRAILDAGLRLLDGSYAKDIKSMREALERESAELIDAEKNRIKIHESMDLESGL